MAKILVVEDDAELNRTVCSYLGMRGHDCVGCADGGAAYDALGLISAPVNAPETADAGL